MLDISRIQVSEGQQPLMEQLAPELKLLILETLASSSCPRSVESLLLLSATNRSFHCLYNDRKFFFLKRALDCHPHKELLLALSRTPALNTSDLSSLVLDHASSPALTLELLHKAFRFARQIMRVSEVFSEVCFKHRRFTDFEPRDDDAWEAATYICFIRERIRAARNVLCYSRDLTREEEAAFEARLQNLYNLVDDTYVSQMREASKDPNHPDRFEITKYPGDKQLRLSRQSKLTVPLRLWSLFGWEWKYRKWFRGDNIYEGSRDDLRQLTEFYEKIVYVEGLPDLE